MILYIMLWLINIFFVLNRRTSKFIWGITYFIMMLLFVSNKAETGDAYIYKMDFENQNYLQNEYEIGYWFLKKILYLLDINVYFGLLIAIAIFVTFVLITGLRKFTCSYHAVLAMVMPFIFPTNAVVIRFFISSVLMIHALYFLLSKKYCRYILVVIFAALFHITACIFLALLGCTSNRMIRINKNNKLWFWLIIGFSILGTVLVYISNHIPFMEALIAIIPSQFANIALKIEIYTTSSTSFGAFIFFVIYFAGLYFSYNVRNSIFLKQQTSENRGNLKAIELVRMAEMNLNIHLMMSIVLPLLALNLVYYRLLILAFLSEAILFGMYIKYIGSSNNTSTIVINTTTLSFLAVCVLWFIPEIVGVNSINIQGLFDASFLFSL